MIKYFNRRGASCWRVDSVLLATGETVEVDFDCWLYELHLANGGNSTLTVSVYDRQSPPHPVIPPNQLPPGAMNQR